MKKPWMLGMVVMVGMLAGHAAEALACGPADRPTARPLPRPVLPVQNVSFQANELVERAARLESTASSHEQASRTLLEQAEILQNRARLLREQIVFVNASDRPGILSVADELALRAADDRSQAARERSEALTLRSEARALRDRAAQLVRLGNGNGGGGWRRRPVDAPAVTDQGLSI